MLQGEKLLQSAVAEPNSIQTAHTHNKQPNTLCAVQQREVSRSVRKLLWAPSLSLRLLSVV